MIRKFAFPACMALALGAAPATVSAGDPTIGFGFTFVFGGGSGGGGAVGVKLFADDEREEVTATLGLDYMFNGAWRPNIGAAYILDGNGYIGADVGYNYQRGTADFGIGAGLVDSDTAAPAGGAGMTAGGSGSGEPIVEEPTFDESAEPIF